MYKCENSAPLRVRIPADMMEKIVRLSEATCLSVSEVVRQLLFRSLA